MTCDPRVSLACSAVDSLAVLGGALALVLLTGAVIALADWRRRQRRRHW